MNRYAYLKWKVKNPHCNGVPEMKKINHSP